MMVNTMGKNTWPASVFQTSRSQLSPFSIACTISRFNNPGYSLTATIPSSGKVRYWSNFRCFLHYSGSRASRINGYLLVLLSLRMNKWNTGSFSHFDKRHLPYDKRNFGHMITLSHMDSLAGTEKYSYLSVENSKILCHGFYTTDWR
jgi:hypothetical protein